MAKKHEIRNSTAEFLIFQAENKEQGIEVMYAEETIWCTQDAIAALFDKGRSTIAEHLQNAFSSGELVKDSVCRKFRRTAADGKEYNTQYYNLDAVISVGYRVNSIRATQFRQWATSVLRQFAIRGYVLDKKRMENGTFLGEDYFLYKKQYTHTSYTWHLTHCVSGRFSYRLVAPSVAPSGHTNGHTNNRETFLSRPLVFLRDRDFFLRGRDVSAPFRETFRCQPGATLGATLGATNTLTKGH